ncbi:MAG: hypothetical protein M0Z95_14495 [Actinomycetota bacterium]|nr:hypothetical protein [Actinomycetota bacterium]
MGLRITEEPDTLLHRAEVKRWVDAYWKQRNCPVCESDDWVAEPRMFMLLRPAPYVGRFRPVFLIRCSECSYVVTVSASTAGIALEPSVPDDLSELEEGND